MQERILILLFWVLTATQVEGQNILNFTIHLDGASQVPTNSSMSAGNGWFMLDGNVVNYAIGLGVYLEPTHAAIYGPALPGEVGRPIFSLGDYIFEAPGEDGEGGGVLYGGGFFPSPEQIHQLQAGLWYVSVASAEFPGGELRGQILLTPENDSDGDGVCDARALCPDTPPFTIVNAD